MLKRIIIVFFILSASAFALENGEEQPSVESCFTLMRRAGLTSPYHSNSYTTLLDAQKLQILTDASERQIPSGFYGSTILAEVEGSDLIINATVRGLNGERNLSVGFAQVRANFPTQSIAVRPRLGSESSGLHFFASSNLPMRKWTVVVTTEPRQKPPGLTGSLTYQADFYPLLTVSDIFIPLSSFKPVVRGRPVEDTFTLENEVSANGTLEIRSLGFQVTRGAIPEGRTNLLPIAADLRIVNREISFGLKLSNADDFASSPLLPELNRIRNTSQLLVLKPEQAEENFSRILRFFQKISDGEYFSREYQGQIVDDGRAIRDGSRRVSFQNLVQNVSSHFSVEELAEGIRSEWENDKGHRGALRLKDRRVSRKTRYEFAWHPLLGIYFRTFRLGEGEERVTSQGYAFFENTELILASQSQLSNYPISESETVRAFSQAIKVFSEDGKTLKTDAVTLKLPSLPGAPFELFGEWDRVTSYR